MKNVNLIDGFLSKGIKVKYLGERKGLGYVATGKSFNVKWIDDDNGDAVNLRVNLNDRENPLSIDVPKTIKKAVNWALHTI